MHDFVVLVISVHFFHIYMLLFSTTHSQSTHQIIVKRELLRLQYFDCTFPINPKWQIFTNF